MTRTNQPSPGLSQISATVNPAPPGRPPSKTNGTVAEPHHVWSCSCMRFGTLGSPGVAAAWAGLSPSSATATVAASTTAPVTDRMARADPITVPTPGSRARRDDPPGREHEGQSGAARESLVYSARAVYTRARERILGSCGEPSPGRAHIDRRSGPSAADSDRRAAARGRAARSNELRAPDRVRLRIEQRAV